MCGPASPHAETGARAPSFVLVGRHSSWLHFIPVAEARHIRGCPFRLSKCSTGVKFWLDDFMQDLRCLAKSRSWMMSRLKRSLELHSSAVREVEHPYAPFTSLSQGSDRGAVFPFSPSSPLLPCRPITLSARLARLLL